EGIKRKILIVDDDNFLLDMYALKFNQNNFDVFTAGNGLQALDKFKGGLKPDVMLVDIIMPEMDGFELLTKVNEDQICVDCVRIILSNKSQQSDIDRGKKLGVAGYIVKANSTPLEVINQVIDILDKKV
ncbi:MAG: response regulator, partial [bacterium]